MRIGQQAAPAPKLKDTDDSLHVKLKDGLTFRFGAGGTPDSMHLEVPVSKLAGAIGSGKDVAKAVTGVVLTPPLVSKTTEVPAQVRHGKLIIDAPNINPAALQLPVFANLKLNNGHLAVLEVATEHIRRDSSAFKADSLRENIPTLQRIVTDLQGQVADYRRALEDVRAGRDVPAELVERLHLPLNVDGKVTAAALKVALRGTTAQLHAADRQLAQEQKQLERIDRGDHRPFVDQGRGAGWRPR